jgi:23S rRNA (cytosine1962-C5)-methyltransferase
VAQKTSKFKDGDVADVFSSSGKLLGKAIMSPSKSIAAQMLAFGEEGIEESIKRNISEAIQIRRRLFDPTSTNAFRLINSEGDGIPGLIVDAYQNLLVIQCASAGIDRFKPIILEHLIREAAPSAIYEKSTSNLRRKEGLQEVRGWLYGDPVEFVDILENGIRYRVDPVRGQKTGFFLDQREMRSWVQTAAKNRKVLNCFAYTGGFSVAALKGGALSVDSVEASAQCGPWIDANLAMNGLFTGHRFISADVFEFFKNTCSWDYDLIILDPPAFIKDKKDLSRGCSSYQALNHQVIQHAKPSTLLLTSSCSAYLDEATFQTLLFKAAQGRNVRILGTHREALDHPISLFHPESRYLKTFLLYII